MVLPCITFCQNCSDLCVATGRVLSRQTDFVPGLARSVVEVRRGVSQVCRGVRAARAPSRALPCLCRGLPALREGMLGLPVCTVRVAAVIAEPSEWRGGAAVAGAPRSRSRSAGLGPARSAAVARACSSQPPNRPPRVHSPQALSRRSRRSRAGSLPMEGQRRRCRRRDGQAAQRQDAIGSRSRLPWARRPARRRRGNRAPRPFRDRARLRARRSRPRRRGRAERCPPSEARAHVTPSSTSVATSANTGASRSRAGRR